MSLFLPAPSSPAPVYSPENEGQYRLAIQQVLRRIAALVGELGQSAVTVTTTYQIRTDDWLIRADTTAGNFTVTLPPAATVKGQVYNVKKIVAANTLTLDGLGAETIDGAANLAWATQYQSYSVISNGVSWDIL